MFLITIPLISISVSILFSRPLFVCLIFWDSFQSVLSFVFCLESINSVCVVVVVIVVATAAFF